MKTLILFCLFLPVYLFGQGIAEKLETYENAYHVEKVYVNHDKPVYTQGDIIWAKVYVLNGRTHEAFDASPVVYVDWIGPSGEIVRKFTLSIKEGSAHFDIPTSEMDSVGKYLIRAYTRYQKNFAPEYMFQKEIFVLDETGWEILTEKEETITDFVVKFFPEGGELVEGLSSQIAFESTNLDGGSLEVEGILYDEAGNELQKMNSLNEGIGLFELAPEKGKKYYTEFVYQGDKKRFELPRILSKGFALQADNLDPNYLRLKIEASADPGVSGATLIGHIRGQVFFSRVFSDKSPKELVIGKGELPSGILHFTLFDSKNNPVSERLVFNKNPKEKLEIGLESNKEAYGKRELVELTIGTFQQGKLHPSQLSISVFDAGFSQAFSHSLSIESYLLLQADLEVKIPNIGQYFQQTSMRSSIILDQLMMTKGWRRFSWQDVFDEKVPELTYPPEEKLTVAGKIKKHNSQELVQADVYLSVLSGSQFTSLNLTTEEDGLFYFTGFEFTDTTDILLQANVFNPKKKKKKIEKGEARRSGNKNVDIELLSFHELTEKPTHSFPNRPLLEANEAVEELVEELQQIHSIDSAFDATYNITLDEIEIEGSQELIRKRTEALKKTYRQQGLFMYSSTPKIFLDDFPQRGQVHRDLHGLINALVPGVRVERGADTIGVYVGRSAGLTGPSPSALIVYDGIPLTNARANRIQANEVLVIDVLKGLQATGQWGSQGAGGVILITSRNPGDRQNLLAAETKIKGVLNLRHPGYYQARQFYAPNYKINKAGPEKPDTRTTLYWNPDIRITEETIPVDFYAGDRASEFLIWVEGISEDGIPFSGGKKIFVEE